MSSQRFNTQLYHVYLVILLLKISEAMFTFQCPVQSHWKHRSEAICDSFDKYFCLYDRNEKKFNESCRDRPDVEKPGYKLIVAGSLQGYPCDHEFYQPFKFSSIGNSRCVYKQSYCSEEGQVVYRNGTEKIVRSCRCDYTRGFDFITRPNNPCLCVPSSEDCSCYHKTCPTKYILSPDYECLNENEWKLNFHCDSIATVVLSKDSGISLSTDNLSFGYHVKAYGMSAFVPVLVMLVIMLSVLVLLFELPVLLDCFNRMQEKRTDFETIPIQNVEGKNASLIANEKYSFKQIDEKDSEKQKLKDEISKLKDNVGNDSYHVQELQKEILQHWSNVLKKVVITKAAQFLYQQIQTKNVIAITGPTGTGKSTYAYHIAFRLQNEYDYTIIPARQPSDITQFYKPGTNQVFIIDDFIGQYAFDEAEGVSWGKIGPLLQKILRNNNQTKVILTCRKSIWHHKTYERFRFSAFVCDLHTKELRLTLSEKRQIFESYIDIACLFGSTQIVQILLYHQSDVDIQDKNGLTPLHLTCMNGQVGLASLLIVARAKVNAIDIFHRTPLYYACIGNYKDIVELLIEYKADINQSTVTGSTPLHAACEKDGIEIATILIENRSNVNVKEETVESPLHIACRHGNERMVYLLIDHSALVNSKTKDKVTPLHEACSNGHQNVVDILLRKNVNYKQRNRNGWTALFFSCANGNNYIVKMLLNLETDVNISSSDGITPLMLACKENHISVVKTLLVSNANVARCNKDKCSPLEYACSSGNTDIINLLLEHGANINWANKKGITPLHTACMNKHAHIVNVLIEKNADINSKDLFGETPLHKACFNCDNEIVKILLHKGAKINITDNSGKSPVAIAKENGFRSIVELLDNANTVLV